MQENNLTILIPIYHPTLTINEILKNLYKQKQQNFNLVIAIDKPSESELYELEKAKTFFSNRLQIIINTNHQHIDSIISSCLNITKTKYTFIMYSYIEIEYDFISKINKLLLEFKDVDIISFDAYTKGISWMNFNRYPKQNKEINIHIEEENVAKIIPFMYNFIAKTSLLIDATNQHNNKHLSEQYSPNILFKTLINANKILLTKDIQVIDWNYDVLLWSVKSLLESWKDIESEYSAHKFTTPFSESYYYLAKFLNIAYCFAGFLGQCQFKSNTKNYLTLKNLKKHLESLISENIEEWKNSKIINDFLEKNRIQQLFELIPNSKKWSLIFKKIIW
ncbi:glycosyltransferase family 2 protein [Metamycoplasma hominis]|uniref:glycosyltransferase family 2 protein n=1 Tax=Metamycoplasma hominis TaxID=2098 RepID=UPI003D9FDA7A